MHQQFDNITIPTRGTGLYEFTEAARRFVTGTGIQTGMLTLFIQHTSASLLIQENADPEVQLDLERFFKKLVPHGDPLFQHTSEGPDDMPAHIRAALTNTSLNIPVQQGEPVLGTWQGVYLYEHRTMPHRRKIVMYCLG